MKLKWPAIIVAPALQFLSLHVSATPPEQFDYMLNCQGCHLPDGRGFPARNVPDLRGHMGKFLMVAGGREFLVQVPGSAQSGLSDAALARLLNWMLETFSPRQLPPSFTPFTPEEVAYLRQEPIIFVSGIREQLVNEIKKYEESN